MHICVCSSQMIGWLVVWNMFLFFHNIWECHHPNWRTHIFQRGRYTTNQIFVCVHPITFGGVLAGATERVAANGSGHFGRAASGTISADRGLQQMRGWLADAAAVLDNQAMRGLHSESYKYINIYVKIYTWRYIYIHIDICMHTWYLWLVYEYTYENRKIDR